MDDIDSFISDEEEDDIEGEEEKKPQDIPAISPDESIEPPNSQKWTHEYSSSNSDKETSPSA